MRLRNRVTKATAWTDGDMLRWHRDKRDFYRSLWACAEDSCCIIDDMFEVKLTAWASPMDADMTVERFEGWRDELVECGKLIPYEADGRRYFFIPTMIEHEKPRNPQSPDWPLPPWVTYAVTGEGRNRRCTYTFTDSRGYRDTTVQTPDGNRNTSPALPCPVLSCTKEEETAAASVAKPLKPFATLPDCMSADTVTPPPEYAFIGKHKLGASLIGYASWRWPTTFRGPTTTPEDLNDFRACVTDGCFDDCPQSKKQREHCYTTIREAITDPRMEGTTWPKKRALFRRIIANTSQKGDRQWQGD